jgi:thioredoxin-dependent peroxiredoxin
MSALTIGDLAPEFSLTDQNGKVHSLKDERGKWVLLYFYPRDNTPGCNKEACMIRDEFPEFEKLNCTVFGVSTDNEKSHKKFEEKFSLPFTLLADSEKTLVKAYGVWAPKKFMGREFLGTLRTSFLIDPKGKVAKVYEKVKPELHAREVVTDLKDSQAVRGFSQTLVYMVVYTNTFYFHYPNIHGNYTRERSDYGSSNSRVRNTGNCTD